MQQVTQNQQEQARAQQRDANLVDAGAALGRGGCCGSLELGAPSASNMSNGAGMTGGQVTGSKPEVTVVVNAFDIDGVNGATSVSTGSGRSPRYDLGLTAVDGKSVSGLDFINLTPTDGCCDERVDNVDSLIENEHLGLKEEQPSQGCCGGNDTGLRHPGAVTEENDLNDKQNIDGQSQTRKHEGGSWSERNQIGHQTILPPLQTTSSVEGK